MTSRNQNRGFRWVEGSIVVLKQIFRFMAMHETLLIDELSGFFKCCTNEEIEIRFMENDDMN